MSVEVDYRWEVNNKGYSWATGRVVENINQIQVVQPSEVDESFFLTEQIALNQPTNKRSVSLNDNPELYREFANLISSNKDILSFANKNGRLGGQFQHIVSLTDNSEIRIGEAYKDWEREITRMKIAVEIWDALRLGSLNRLFDVWNEPAKTSWADLDQSLNRMIEARLSQEDFAEEDSWSRQPERIATDSNAMLQEIVNYMLQRDLPLRLLPVPDTNDFMLRLVPDSLVTAMWLQFAQAISSAHEYGQCDVCEKWFVASEGKGKPKRRYCSDACRVKAQRLRKKLAE